MFLGEGSERLVTIAVISWTMLKCWRHQSDCLISFNVHKVMCSNLRTRRMLHVVASYIVPGTSMVSAWPTWTGRNHCALHCYQSCLTNSGSLAKLTCARHQCIVVNQSALVSSRRSHWRLVMWYFTLRVWHNIPVVHRITAIVTRPSPSPKNICSLDYTYSP